MDTPTIFTFIGESVTNATSAFIGPAAASLMTALQAVALAGVSLYILLMGFAILMGQVQAPIAKVLTQWFKITLILSIALTAGNYSTYVVDVFTGLEQGLADALNVGGTTPGSIYTVLDDTVGQGVDLARQCLRNADDAGFDFGSVIGWGLAALVMSIGTAVVAVFGGAAIIVAKFALAVMFAVGPFFILLLMFPVTARFFDAWFGQVMNYTILVVIVAVIMAFAMAAFGAMIGGADMSGGDDVNPLMASIQVFILCLVLVFIIRESRGMAAGVAGGLSMSALTAAHLLTPARIANNVVNTPSTRRDMQSGMMTTGGRLNHMIAGNTILNPAYSQYVMKQAGRNWSRAKGGKVTPK